jgi:hypothetical protein
MIGVAWPELGDVIKAVGASLRTRCTKSKVGSSALPEASSR